MQKKVLSLILVLCLLFGMLPHGLAAPAAAAERRQGHSFLSW